MSCPKYTNFITLKKADYATLVQAANPLCRGRLGYQEGPEYVFEIDRSKDECGTQITNNATHVVYKNGLQGYMPVSNQTHTDAVRYFSHLFSGLANNLIINCNALALLV